MVFLLTSLNLPCCCIIPFLLVLLSREVKTRLLTDAVFGRTSNSKVSVISNFPLHSLVLEMSEVSAVREIVLDKMGDQAFYILQFISFPSRLCILTAGCALKPPMMEGISSLLSFTLHLYYFVKVLSSIILKFYRSEA